MLFVRKVDRLRPCVRLRRQGPKLTTQECNKVKRITHELLDTLKATWLMLAWRNRQQTRAVAFVAIQNVLENLPKNTPTTA